MRVRTVGAALLAGGGAGLVVFLAVSEALLDDIEFSVFVGIPAGLVAGVLVATIALWGLDRDAQSSALARGTAACGLTLITAVTLGIAVGAGVLATTGGAAIAGLLVGSGVYLRYRVPTE